MDDQKLFDILFVIGIALTILVVNAISYWCVQHGLDMLFSFVLSFIGFVLVWAVILGIFYILCCKPKLEEVVNNGQEDG